jgi:hypothetical protein
MHAVTNIIAAIAVGAVVVVLFAGFANMIRGGNPNLSQKLMRWRVGLQFVAILVIIGILWLRR